jgi:diacylglycerol kinase family enzyme/thymidylate kinase
MNGTQTTVAAVVGIDGSGKSSAFRGALGHLAGTTDVVGIGDVYLAGAPGVPVHHRADLPFQRAALFVARRAKRTRQPFVYRQLKTVDLIARSHMREYVVAREQPDVVLTDGDPLLNTLAWSAARLYRGELSDDEGRILDAMAYLSGQARIPRSELPYYLGHAWQLVALTRLTPIRFRLPDVVVLLQIDGASAMQRIRVRGRSLQAHESAEALDALAAGYERVCTLAAATYGVPLVRISATATSKLRAAEIVAQAVGEHIPERAAPRLGDPDDPPIEVVATTISGSLQDQRKIGRIVPQFSSRTRRPVRLHSVDSHAEAEAVTHGVVAAGGRVIVSAGGGGTFNAVLEGCHLDGHIPDDVRLGFLRKGSADLIGKVLRVPDTLPEASAAIVDGIEHDRRLRADVIAVDTRGPEGEAENRHMIGFGGLGIFGAVPRFTEARWIKYYKGIIGSIAGDYGPFYTGLSLATAWWYWQRLWGRVVPLVLELDGVAMEPDGWTAIIVVGGDLGPDFPVGRDAPFSSGTLRVVGLRDRGLRAGLRQLRAARSGAIFAVPEQYDCLIADVRSLEVRKADGQPGADRPDVVNVDGLARRSYGPVRFSVSGRVELILGP